VSLLPTPPFGQLSCRILWEVQPGKFALQHVQAVPALGGGILRIHCFRNGAAGFPPVLAIAKTAVASRPRDLVGYLQTFVSTDRLLSKVREQETLPHLNCPL